MLNRFSRCLGVVGRAVHVAAMGGLLVVAGAAVYQYSKGHIVAGIYRDRLHRLSEDYDALAGRYNDVVRKTAVTELVLADGRLSVVVRTAEGVLRTIPTDIDASQEVHVEYIAQQGRLWIRRVYSLSAPDARGRARAEVTMIDPSLAELPWSDEPGLQGLSVFRKELTEGRWVVTATGNAALALRKVPEGSEPILSPPPAVRDYPEMVREIEAEIDALTMADVADHVLGSVGLSKEQ